MEILILWATQEMQHCLLSTPQAAAQLHADQTAVVMTAAQQQQMHASIQEQPHHPAPILHAQYAVIRPQTAMTMTLQQPLHAQTPELAIRAAIMFRLLWHHALQTQNAMTATRKLQIIVSGREPQMRAVETWTAKLNAQLIPIATTGIHPHLTYVQELAVAQPAAII